MLLKLRLEVCSDEMTIHTSLTSEVWKFLKWNVSAYTDRTHQDS